MATPSLSISEDLLDEVDNRCDLNRSRYVRDALSVRMMLEDEGEWYSTLARAKTASREASDSAEQEAQAEN